MLLKPLKQNPMDFSWNLSIGVVNVVKNLSLYCRKEMEQYNGEIIDMALKMIDS